MKYDLSKVFILSSLLAILAVMLLSCSTKESTSSPALAPEILAEYDAIKLTVTQEGMYRISLDDFGWDENVLDSIAVTNNEQPIPFWIENNSAGHHIIFFGQPTASPYTPENIYVIQQNPALAQEMTKKSTPESGGSAVDYIISTIHSEENTIYAPKVKNGSPWHWSKIVAPQSQTLEINLPGATGGAGYLRMALWGVTSAPTSPAHHVRVSINDKNIGEVAWDGQTWHILEAEIPANVLIDGKNTIEIQATGEIEARIDIINLDWVEIDYQKSSDSLDSQEIFRVPRQAVRLNGFEQLPTIFEVSTASEVSLIELPPDQQIFISFKGNPELRYLAVSPDGYLYPDQIFPTAITPDLRAESGATYLVIGHPELLEPLEPLLKMRDEQGMSTLTIPVETIYDQFNGGLVEPQAIQYFLKFAVDHWAIQPRYVLLVGDTSYDYYGYQSPVEKYFLPTFLVDTVFGGETGSDVVMVQINQDQWPDLAIGRVPARNIQQVETFVKKTINFEQSSPTAPWNRSILAVADGQEPIFRADADHFIQQIPASFQTQLIAPEPGVTDANQQIAADIEAGQLLTVYFGHGSINMWGKDSLFTIEDSADLDNAASLSVILNFTCLTGLFTHPTEESLAESLLFNPNGGAVAVLAPTSPTLPTDQTFLSDAFIEAMLQEPVPRLGDITLYAWRKVPTSSESALDVMQTFLLFGDPALNFPNP